MTISYHVTLVCVNTQEELGVDIEQSCAIEAQRVAEGLYEGYRVTRISRNPDLWSNAPAIADGALGDF